jgi:hypothetical protein
VTLAELTRLPTYAVFARCARIVMRDALVYERRAEAEPDYWLSEWQRTRAKRLRLAAWDHLAAAKKAKRLAG